MKKLFLLILITAFGIHGPDGVSEKASGGQRYTKQQLTEDLIQIKQVIMENHPRIYRFISEDEFSNLFDQISGNLHDGMDQKEFLIQSAPLITRVGCVHSMLLPPLDFVKSPHGITCPLKLFIHRGRFYSKGLYGGTSPIPRARTAI